MRSTIGAFASLVALCGAVSLSPPGFAQEAPAASAAPTQPMHEHWSGHRRERAETRAKALHDILNIQAGQDAAFQAFIASMEPPEDHDGMREQRDGAESQALTTPERLDRMAGRLAKRQAAFQRRAEAIKAFYAVLGPDQKRAFDALHGMMGRHGGGHDWGGRGGEEPHHQG